MKQRPDRPELDFAANLDFDQILTNPILDIGARVWEEDRYLAFRICYRSMRRIDDLIDDRKEGGEAISPKEIDAYADTIFRWLQALEGGEPVDSFQEELLATFRHFDIPPWPWQRLCGAMLYDLTHDGFPTLMMFRRYAEGAAIAPASVFMHLCGLRTEGRTYHRPDFDIRKASSDLALFSYFVHIMRDFEKDQRRRLNYFADDLLAQHGLSRDDLYRAAEGGPVPEGLRELMARYKAFADFYRDRARRRLDHLAPRLAPRYRLSLEIIYELYLQIFERVNVRESSFSADELMPSPDEVRQRLTATIDAFATPAP